MNVTQQGDFQEEVRTQAAGVNTEDLIFGIGNGGAVGSSPKTAQWALASVGGFPGDRPTSGERCPATRHSIINLIITPEPVEFNGGLVNVEATGLVLGSRMPTFMVILVLPFNRATRCLSNRVGSDHECGGLNTVRGQTHGRNSI